MVCKGDREVESTMVLLPLEEQEVKSEKWRAMAVRARGEKRAVGHARKTLGAKEGSVTGWGVTRGRRADTRNEAEALKGGGGGVGDYNKRRAKTDRREYQG